MDSTIKIKEILTKPKNKLDLACISELRPQDYDIGKRIKTIPNMNA